METYLLKSQLADVLKKCADPATPGHLTNQAVAKLAEAGGRILIRVGRRADRVELEVADDGPGVPPALRERIFEPFFSLRRDGRGAGLGLAVTYALVKEHDGDIVHRPVEGGGASFVVSFPAFEPVDE